MEVDFIWLLDRLVEAGPVQVHIPETALITGGEVSAVYYTDSEGDLRKGNPISANQLCARFKTLRRRRGVKSTVCSITPCGVRVPLCSITQEDESHTGKSPWKNFSGIIQCPVSDGYEYHYQYKDNPPSSSPSYDQSERFLNFHEMDSRVLTSAVPVLFGLHLGKLGIEILAGRFSFLKVADRKFWFAHVTGLTVRIETMEERKAFRRYFSGELCQDQVDDLVHPQPCGSETEVPPDRREKALRFSEMLNQMSNHFSVVKKDIGIECFHERGQHCHANDACFLHRQFVDHVTHIPVLQGTSVNKIYDTFGAKITRPICAKRPGTAPRTKPPKINFSIAKRPRSSGTSRPQTARLWTPPCDQRRIYGGAESALRVATDSQYEPIVSARRLSTQSVNCARSSQRSTSKDTPCPGDGNRVKKSEITFPPKLQKLLDKAGPSWGPLGDFPSMNFGAATKRVKESKINKLRIVMVPEKSALEIPSARRIARRKSEPH